MKKRAAVGSCSPLTVSYGHWVGKVIKGSYLRIWMFTITFRISFYIGVMCFPLGYAVIMQTQP